MSDFVRFLEELRNRLNITNIVGRRVSLKRKGRDQWGCCPFHGEKTPSFKVDESRGTYHCFGCHAHGDAIKFVMETENLSFYEAIKQLAESTGLELPQQTPTEKKQIQKRKSLFDITELATGFYEAKLRSEEGKEALTYLLENRKLTWETIENFRIGYAPDSEELYTILQKQNIPDSDLVQAGLFRKYDGSSKMYAYLKNRIIFPIQNRKGSILAFSGRILGAGEPKYLNTPETELFHKRETLYGLYQARENAFKNNHALLCEGQIDVITLHQFGFTTAMATLGTALTEHHLRHLWKMAEAPILCFDGDSAGKKAGLRALNIAIPLLQSGKTLHIAFLPQNMDPDDLLKMPHGKEKFESLLKNSLSLSDALWESTYSPHTDTHPEDHARIEKELTEIYNKIPDPVLRMHLIRDFKNKLWQAFRNHSKKTHSRDIPLNTSEEREVIHLLILYPQLFLEWEEKLINLIQKKDILVILQKLSQMIPLTDEEEKTITPFRIFQTMEKLTEETIQIKLEKIILNQSLQAMILEKSEVQQRFSQTSAREDWQMLQDLQKEIQRLKEKIES
ncbi:MAG: DNA primase [Alphaproteobacteria bacterium]|nr:DNA primase [Alphaproteobacteria bacterium]